MNPCLGRVLPPAGIRAGLFPSQKKPLPVSGWETPESVPRIRHRRGGSEVRAAARRRRAGCDSGGPGSESPGLPNHQDVSCVFRSLGVRRRAGTDSDSGRWRRRPTGGGCRIFSSQSSLGLFVQVYNSMYAQRMYDHCGNLISDISRFFPRIDLFCSWKALNPFFGAQGEGFTYRRSR